MQSSIAVRVFAKKTPAEPVVALQEGEHGGIHLISEEHKGCYGFELCSFQRLALATKNINNVSVARSSAA